MHHCYRTCTVYNYNDSNCFLSEAERKVQYQLRHKEILGK